MPDLTIPDTCANEDVHSNRQWTGYPNILYHSRHAGSNCRVRITSLHYISQTTKGSNNAGRIVKYSTDQPKIGGRRQHHEPVTLGQDEGGAAIGDGSAGAVVIGESTVAGTLISVVSTHSIVGTAIIPKD